MKSIVMPLTEQVSEKESNKMHEDQPLSGSNGEPAKKSMQKTFTASEMWRLRNRMRSASGVLRKWDLN